MLMNSLREEFWDLAHRLRAQILTDGFCQQVPLLTPQENRNQTADLNVYQKWKDRLALDATWPKVLGPLTAKIFVIVEHDLNQGELEFVRRWFENDRLKLNFSQDIQIHPWPDFPHAEDAREFFKELILQVKPKVLLSLGCQPAARLLQAPPSLETLRAGDFPFEGFPLVTTHHPGAILALDSSQDTLKNLWKSQIWKDAQRTAGKLRLV
ncbi:MAG: hypothetical protein HKM06_05755 [Spirochaetales bacterium]|nr:hypothetical protein [Spirochaetales bacterium]